jgi:hypothetical protein
MGLKIQPWSVVTGGFTVTGICREVAPSESVAQLVTIFGSNLGPPNAAGTLVDASGKVATLLSNTVVLKWTRKTTEKIAEVLGQYGRSSLLRSIPGHVIR